ncbi:MAG: CHAT domain-containing protein, partial [Acidobacteriota bacterium]
TPPPPLPDALRILVAISSPEGYAPLDLQQERQHLERVWGASEAVQLTFLEHTDVETLHEALLTGRHHILHYMGHGDFEPSSGEGTLLFETPEGKPHALSGKALAVELKNFRTLRLVFLNACDTARATDADGRDPFGGVATALVMGGLPAVVAMQFPISDRAAIVFSKMVYQRLAEGHPVDTAVAEGRLAIYRDDPETMEWGTPVLFLRSPDGRLFDTSPGVRATEDIPVSAITEAIAEATAESARERFRKLGQMPRLPKNRRLAIAGGLAMLLALLVVGLVPRWRAEPSSTGSATGLALAILEPRNLSSQPEDQWIATTIAEILVTELALGGGVRTVAGDALARALHDLELDPAESLSVGDLDRLRRYLGIDYLLTGAYSLTTGDSSQLRLDLRLLEAATGDLWTSAGGNSPEGELFTLLGDLSRQLRRWLGAAKLSAPQRKVARASLPADPQARRLYCPIAPAGRFGRTRLAVAGDRGGAGSPPALRRLGRGLVRTRL